MAKTATVRARVEPRLKQNAEKVLGSLGLTPTVAVQMFYEQVVQRRGIPFDVALPNKTTRKAMRDAELGRDVVKAKSAKDMFAKLDSD